MKKLLLATLMFWSGVIMAQDYSRQEWKEIEDADIDFEIGDFLSAVNVYEEILKKHANEGDMQLKAGICYFYLRQYEKANAHLTKARELKEYEANFYLGQTYHLEGKLEEEIDLYHEYLAKNEDPNHSRAEINHLIDQAETAQDLIENPINVNLENMGSSINSEFHEYVPLVYGSEDEIYFTSRRPGSTGEKLDHRGDHFEDIYYSQHVYGFWQKPEQLPAPINTETHDACVGISSDGQILYLFRTSEDLVSGDLYSVKKSLLGWSEPELLPGEINSDAIETSASISNDEHTVYFSSNREGGYGGMDIWRVKKLPTGDWSKAQNLGSVINTEYDEDSPFIHADGKTLYFISKGHKSMGGYDIFQTQVNEEGKWSKPVNLGYPVNSLANDLNFVMSADKLTGYYSSSATGGYGGQDLYKIHFKLDAEILSVVKGGVASNDTSHIPIEAVVTLIDKRTKAVQGEYKSNASTGTFIMVVTPGSSYQVVVEADGYHTYSGEVYFDDAVGFGQQIEEFKLIPLQVSSND